MKHSYDLLVIGAGSAGLAAAERASSLGASVALIEAGNIGGTCVNQGCIPKKITWYAADLGHAFCYAKNYGFKKADHQLNFAALVKARGKYINSLRKHYSARLQKDKIHYVAGQAKFVDKHTLSVNKEIYHGKHIIIATGTTPNQAEIEGAEFGIDSNGFFDLKKMPKKAVIIGGGYIAMELSSILNLLGVEVELVVRGDAILSKFDNTLVEHLTQVYKDKKIKINYKQEAIKITRDSRKKLTAHCTRNKKITNVDCVLFAIGRHPRTQGMNLAATGVKLDENKYVKTDKWEASSVPHIYAIGDVAGKKLLTPVAVAAGRKLATRIFGRDKKVYMDYESIPSVVFTHPPIGTVGMTEDEAVEKYGRKNITIYQTTFVSLYFALSADRIKSCMKLVTLKKNKKILGCHIVDLHADEILQGFAVAIKMGATKDDLDNTVGIHPTSAEEMVTMKN